MLERCRERVNILASVNGFLHVVSRLGSQTSVSVQSLQITVCECREFHTKGTSLPKAQINWVLATVTTTDRLKPVQGCLFNVVVTSEQLSLWQRGRAGTGRDQGERNFYGHILCEWNWIWWGKKTAQFAIPQSGLISIPSFCRRQNTWVFIFFSSLCWF